MTGTIEVTEVGGKVRTTVVIGQHRLIYGRSTTETEILAVVGLKIDALIRLAVNEVVRLYGPRPEAKRGRTVVTWPRIACELSGTTVTVGNHRLTIVAS